MAEESGPRSGWLSSRPTWPIRLAAVAAASALALDQITKAMALRHLAFDAISLAPFLNLRLGFNRGVSFGLLASDSAWGPAALIAMTSVIALVVVYWIWRARDPLEGVSLGSILGGALGNLVDRVRQGAVTDFIDVYYGTSHWPAFNIADVAITCGAAGFLIAGFRADRPPERG